MKNTWKFTLAVVMSVIMLAGCQNPLPSSNELSSDEAGESQVKTTEGWADVGTKIGVTERGSQVIFSGFTSEDTMLITLLRSGSYVYIPVPYYYTVKDGMNIAIGEEGIEITLLKADRENNRIQVKAVQEKY